MAQVDLTTYGIIILYFFIFFSIIFPLFFILKLEKILFYRILRKKFLKKFRA